MPGPSDASGYEKRRGSDHQNARDKLLGPGANEPRPAALCWWGVTKISGEQLGTQLLARETETRCGQELQWWV
jgi:hypothetical protein